MRRAGLLHDRRMRRNKGWSVVQRGHPPSRLRNAPRDPVKKPAAELRVYVSGTDIRNTVEAEGTYVQLWVRHYYTFGFSTLSPAALSATCLSDMA